MTNKTRLLTIGLVVFSCTLLNAWAQADADTPSTPADPGQQQPASHPVATTYSEA
jgi:hypothetical protein